MMKFNVFNRISGAVQFTAEIDTTEAAATSVKLGLAVKWAIKTGANLYGANLRTANLRTANLSGANLYGADLRTANLSGANLRTANLYGANLSGANLRTANLSGADLYGANLRTANLSGADLYGANLSGADLRTANLSGADLYGANLSGADLYGADLRTANLKDTKDGALVIARTRILPPEGQVTGWKKCQGGTIVKLLIPAKAERSHAFGRKCRADHVKVLEVIGAAFGISIHDGKTKYAKGKIVRCDAWSDNWQEECAGGIHFYITREEAEAHS